MSVVDVVSRMAQIQSSIAQMTAPAATVATAAPSVAAKTASTVNAASFAQALTAATGGSVAAAASVSPSIAVPGAATGQAIAEDAKKYVGIPYVWGGTDPAKGLDCSGLVQRVYKDFGIDLPRVAVDQGNAGTTVPNLAAAKPGDLLVMRGGEHIGIYMGNNQYIHAPQPGQNVQIAEIPAGAVFDKITRIIPEKTPAVTTPASNLTDIVTAAQAALMKGAAA